MLLVECLNSCSERITLRATREAQRWVWIAKYVEYIMGKVEIEDRLRKDSLSNEIEEKKRESDF